MSKQPTAAELNKLSFFGMFERVYEYYADTQTVSVEPKSYNFWKIYHKAKVIGVQRNKWKNPGRGLLRAIRQVDKEIEDEVRARNALAEFCANSATAVAEALGCSPDDITVNVDDGYTSVKIPRLHINLFVSKLSGRAHIKYPSLVGYDLSYFCSYAQALEFCRVLADSSEGISELHSKFATVLATPRLTR